MAAAAARVVRPRWVNLRSPAESFRHWARKYYASSPRDAFEAGREWQRWKSDPPAAASRSRKNTIKQEVI